MLVYNYIIFVDSYSQMDPVVTARGKVEENFKGVVRCTGRTAHGDDVAKRRKRSRRQRFCSDFRLLFYFWRRERLSIMYIFSNAVIFGAGCLVGHVAGAAAVVVPHSIEMHEGRHSPNGGPKLSGLGQ
ncbi:hypothetical protein RB195_007929 [Necator americanus]|uniref:Transmembrane protein n=1 Tax=Necator americanus TaxID=51031 RepID=A0ABR1BZL2_NECAM